MWGKVEVNDIMQIVLRRHRRYFTTRRDTNVLGRSVAPCKERDNVTFSWRCHRFSKIPRTRSQSRIIAIKIFATCFGYARYTREWSFRSRKYHASPVFRRANLQITLPKFYAVTHWVTLIQRNLSELMSCSR